MYERAIKVDTMRLGGDVCAIVKGELDLLSAGEMMAVGDRLLRERPNLLILDLVRLDYMDSSGLRVLLRLGCLSGAQSTPMQIHVRDGSPPHRVLRLVGADQVLDVIVEVEERSGADKPQRFRPRFP